MFLLVAVPIPTLDLLTYTVPDGTPIPAIGARVIVPVGKRTVTGIVTGIDVARPGGVATEIKPIRCVLDAEPLIPQDVLELARWTAEYYAAGAGETITAVLPPKTRTDRADGHKTRRTAVITAAGLDAVDRGTPKQREALALLAGSPRGLSSAALTARGIGPHVITRLTRLGFVTLQQERVERSPFESSSLDSGSLGSDRTLTAEQEAGLDRLTQLSGSGFRVVLLHGVTGSGKTEMYVRLSREVVGKHRRVIMLVPEIALTPAVAGEFRQAFGDRVAIQHSALSDGERHDQWQRIRRGDVDVVVGTRSAVFAPVQDVGLVIVDEEHDASYKQDESPRYNARDVAIVRGQRADALVVLGSATPSIETYHNAITGRFERVVLERRVLDRPLPDVTIVDMKEEYAAGGADVILSRVLSAAIVARLESGAQTLLLLNRRGFATAVFCRQCGGTLECPNCSICLVVHGQGPGRTARCHYCNYATRVPPACPHCAGPYLDQAGFGTERVESEVRRLFPSARTARLDRDTVRRKGALVTLLARFRRGEVDVLVGTQMIAKGHDFPRVTLVGVISADVGLGTADFRASERTFQLLTQVAGRAGRGAAPGQAIIQTIYPQHYGVQLACRQDYRAFYEREIAFRRAMRYPPHTALLNVIVRARTFGQAMADAEAVACALGRDGAQLRVLGPAPAPLARLRGEYRAQLLLKGVQRRRMREALQAVLAARPELARRATVDVDPLNVL